MPKLNEETKRAERMQVIKRRLIREIPTNEILTEFYVDPETWIVNSGQAENVKKALDRIRKVQRPGLYDQARSVELRAAHMQLAIAVEAALSDVLKHLADIQAEQKEHEEWVRGE